jgi:hypothetical protein
MTFKEEWPLSRGTILLDFTIQVHLKSDLIRRVAFGGSGHLRRGGGLMYMTIFQLIIDFFFFAAYIL